MTRDDAMAQADALRVVLEKAGMTPKDIVIVGVILAASGAVSAEMAGAYSDAIPALQRGFQESVNYFRRKHAEPEAEK